MAQPKISVIVVNFNRRANLYKSLRAIYTQLENIESELIVTDDGSTDSSVALAMARGATVIWVPHNDRRTAAARWRGAQLATGELLLFVDSDIVLNPNAIAAYLAAYERHPDRAMGGYFKYLPGMNVPDEYDWDRLWNAEYPKTGVDQGQVLVGLDPREAMGQMYYFDNPNRIFGAPYSLISANMAVPRHIYEAAGGWDYKMVGRGQDGEFSVRIANAGYGFSYLMGAKGVHLAHPVGEHKGPSPHKYLAAKYPELYVNDTFEWPGRGVLERTTPQLLSALRGEASLSIRICSPSEVGGRPETQRLWGDHWAKDELARCFTEMGHKIVGGHPNKCDPDVLLHLSGGEIEYIYKEPIERLARDAYKIVWVYSHPEKVTPTSLKGYDQIFCCSVPFAEKMRAMGYEVTTLLAATSKHPVKRPVKYDVGFVGGTRGAGGRPAIAALRASGIQGLKVMIYGPGWTKYVPPEWYGDRYYPYHKLGDFYASCKFVLQDHRPQMAAEGFVSIKLYDILASGSLPISDPNPGIKQVFKGAVPEYTGPAHLRSIIEYYLEHEEERLELIRRGQEIALAANWPKRAELLLRKLRS